MLLKNVRIVVTVISLFTLSVCYSQESFFEKFGNIEPTGTKENSVVEGWRNYYFSTEECMCVYGGEFFVALKEMPSQTRNLMISLQGGGACWPGTIKCKPNTSDEDVKTAKFISLLDERINEDWNKVFIPYCDGSIYMGDTEQDYNSDNTIDHWHNGLKISVATLKFVQKKFPDASKIFLTGCSAGGYGTIIQLRLIRYLYPEASIYVLNESGPGLFRPDTDFWNMVDSSWDLNQLIPTNCSQCEGQLIYWYDDMLNDPKVKIGLYSSYMDHVISSSFLKMEPEEYKSLLLKTTEDLKSKHPDQFKRFFINGTSHCVEDRNYEVKGTKYWDWILAFISDNESWVDILE